MGAGGTGIIDLMLKAMGPGWCFTFIALVCMVASPMLWAELKWGPGWREERRAKEDVQEKEEERRQAIEDAAAEEAEVGVKEK